VPKVSGVLAGLPGFIEAEAAYPEKEARVIYDPGLIGVDRIIQDLLRAGYSAALKESTDSPPPFATLAPLEKDAFRPDELICYCFGYTRGAIEKDFLQHQRSLIMERIAVEKRAGGCDCVNKNPKGR
jgi:copper chaperone CopZ